MASVDEVVAWIRKSADPKVKAGMARYGIPSDRAFGIPMGVMKKKAKELGREHSLALGLWNTGHYEARILAGFLGEPEAMTSAQIDAWCREFDNWAVVDSVCFNLFDRTEARWKKVHAWARRKDEFQKRASFALLASLVAHDKHASDAQFLECFPLIEEAAHDERNFVWKGVSWALRSIGKRKSLKKPALEFARRLAETSKVGREAVREFTR
ncbi:MAG: DNA alkylation repair protein [Archangium sp.]